MCCVGFAAEIVFALDSTVSEENFQKELDFVKHLAESFSITKLLTLVVYGESAQTILFDPTSGHLSGRIQSKGRRMDLALSEAASNFSKRTNQHQLVVLITAGKQSSGAVNKENNQDLLVSASEKLYSKDIKVTIVSVGMETDFKELVLIVKRPQSLFRFFSFDDMLLDTAATNTARFDVASNIRKILGEISFILCSVYFSFDTLLALSNEGLIQIQFCSWSKAKE